MLGRLKVGRHDRRNSSRTKGRCEAGTREQGDWGCGVETKEVDDTRRDKRTPCWPVDRQEVDNREDSLAPGDVSLKSSQHADIPTRSRTHRLARRSGQDVMRKQTDQQTNRPTDRQTELWIESPSEEGKLLKLTLPIASSPIIHHAIISPPLPFSRPGLFATTNFAINRRINCKRPLSSHFGHDDGEWEDGKHGQSVGQIESQLSWRFPDSSILRLSVSSHSRMLVCWLTLFFSSICPFNGTFPLSLFLDFLASFASSVPLVLNSSFSRSFVSSFAQILARLGLAKLTVHFASEILLSVGRREEGALYGQRCLCTSHHVVVQLDAGFLYYEFVRAQH
ncbi:unnamed protein product [Protopolystoma xenopodis]|uniref:Uncharacterized protein n=1 Tax=Protopolystoma xenopodis TaxID=117903 RepID=A0A3S5ALB8_9PLAT|nr:unnamed protein product [Protopolystoma xenopodis]